MLKKTSIEETFRNAFDNYEADVNDQVWLNIEQQIATPPTPIGENLASQAGKSILSNGKFSALTYGIATTVIIAIVASIYIYTTPDKKPISNHIEKNIPSKSEINSLAQIENPTADAKHENNLNSQLPVANTVSDQKFDQAANEATIDSQTEVKVTDVTKSTFEEKNNSTSSEKQGDPGLESTTNNSFQTNKVDEINETSSADEKHETPKEAVQINEEQKLPLEQPTQNDDFEWGLIANSFSPNNDGKNDAFIIKTQGLASIEVTIYNPQNGKIIYLWNQLDGSWDGKDLSGKDMPAGFYLYSIFAKSIDGKSHSKKGTLYIFR